MVKKWYVVTVGTQPGVYDNWPETASKVIGISGAVYQSFKDEAAAYEVYERARNTGATTIRGARRQPTGTAPAALASAQSVDQAHTQTEASREPTPPSTQYTRNFQSSHSRTPSTHSVSADISPRFSLLANDLRTLSTPGQDPSYTAEGVPGRENARNPGLSPISEAQSRNSTRYSNVPEGSQLSSPERLPHNPDQNISPSTSRTDEKSPASSGHSRGLEYQSETIDEAAFPGSRRSRSSRESSSEAMAEATQEGGVDHSFSRSDACLEPSEPTITLIEGPRSLQRSQRSSGSDLRLDELRSPPRVRGLRSPETVSASPRSRSRGQRSFALPEVHDHEQADLHKSASQHSRTSAVACAHSNNGSGRLSAGKSRRSCACDCHSHSSKSSARPISQEASPRESPSSPRDRNRIRSWAAAIDPNDLGFNSLGLYQSARSRQTTYAASEDPRSPLSRTASLPKAIRSFPFGRPSPALSLYPNLDALSET